MAETVHTVKASGGDYTSLNAWSAGRAADITADANVPHVAECYGFQDTTAATIGTGWVTDATHWLEIRAAAGAEAQMPYDTGGTAYSRETAGAASGWCIYVQEDFVKIKRIQMSVRNATAAGDWGVKVNYVGAGAKLWIEGCNIARRDGASGSGNQAIRSEDTQVTLYISNCCISDFAEATDIAISPVAGLAVYAYNNTVINCMTGLDIGAAGTFVAINNLYDSQGLASANGFNGAITTSYNSTDLAESLAGTGDRNSQTHTYANEGTDDFHLAANDAGARTYGTDLSGDGNYPITIDFDGTTRPTGAGMWDIGAHNVTVASGGGGAPIRLIGGGLTESMLVRS